MTNSEFINNQLSPAETLTFLKKELIGWKGLRATALKIEDVKEAEYQISKIQRQIEQTERLESDIANGTY